MEKTEFGKKIKKNSIKPYILPWTATGALLKKLAHDLANTK